MIGKGRTAHGRPEGKPDTRAYREMGRGTPSPSMPGGRRGKPGLEAGKPGGRRGQHEWRGRRCPDAYRIGERGERPRTWLYQVGGVITQIAVDGSSPTATYQCGMLDE
ncbi:hypothetical protein SVIO_012920 [Streptomyces violaceusniger]|uniref:Uncharacterized protein n=1 Tax=Streptomyces violaceusniger TaxID=68280 RepID=A0A4D4KXW5_STRVO|nr:hypothetical protein SVIO_012920 [Streptomyces violaceusniger]